MSGEAPSSRRVAASDDAEVSTYLGIAKEKRGREPVLEEAAKGVDEAVVVLDFGSQYSRLIARRIRECHVYCELYPHDVTQEQLAHLKVKGFILSGGPASVYDEGAPLISPHVLASRVPILGICYGMQALAYQLGGKVAPGAKREYGHAVLHQNAADHPLFRNLPTSMPVWMSHGDQVTELPSGFRALAFTESSPNAVIGNEAGLVGLQFHPEVVHTPHGRELLRNWLQRVCGCQGTWTPGNFIAESIDRIREQVGGGRVICALSGGVDSAVAATLIQQAVGDQLTCIFVDNGLLRREEPERVRTVFQRNLKMNLVYVDAQERF
ncbi:MAG: glutamine-hydrolyzing GMP synthase, partial [Chloroflexi bacterium]|nr:glutamine-hydrolyzing GMP synthase [Chloroflexota bacterium]